MIDIDNKIFFSVIIPTYNRQYFIGKAIQSVLNQTYSNFEIIIVDDGSTDNTKDIVKTFSDNRIRYFWTKNQERGAARNFGIRKSKGNYVCFLDSDDIYLNDHLAIGFNNLSENKCAFYFSNYSVVDNDNNIVLKNFLGNEKDCLMRISYNNFLCPIGVFFRSDIAEKYLFSEDRNFTIGEDLYVFLRIIARFGINFNHSVTAHLIQHNSRTMSIVDPSVIDYSVNKMICLLKKDIFFFDNYSFLIPIIEANHISLQSLYLSMESKKLESVKMLIKAIKLNFKELFKRRTVAIIKYLIFS
ncbi:glycosyltransferase family 2 protein [Flammeovirga pacifica]|uniref:Glycosyltransferase 2-like domain-containing protein n=1 Tax=Flammeovirga pacifica TaxID=915059 RepID=A0A1S1YX28_FLAPC|nr:glycosyltransferase [Flammeovirga pacifica]OHX65557.1 hypothetical protein NH26_03940 [Flammeovirga pacifica]